MCRRAYRPSDTYLEVTPGLRVWVLWRGMDVILGLDVSTSIIGWTVISSDAPLGSLPMKMDHIDLRKVDGFWNKADTTQRAIQSIVTTLNSEGHRVVKFAVENPVTKFRAGKSTAGTIVLLARFNAMASYFGRIETGSDPVYIDATDARKSLGVKLLSRKKAGGKGQKEQTFEFLATTVFKGRVWPVNKNSNMQPYCYDQVDSYVIAIAAAQGRGSTTQ